jgi:hypothetical protein
MEMGAPISGNGSLVPTSPETKAQEIVKAVVNSIMPWVKSFLLRVEKDHKGNKSKVIRPPVAVAMAKLVNKLEAPLVPVATLIFPFTTNTHAFPEVLVKFGAILKLPFINIIDLTSQTVFDPSEILPVADTFLFAFLYLIELFNFI